MLLRNIWLLKAREKNLLKIVEWAQKNGVKVEELTKIEILDALRTQRP